MENNKVKVTKVTLPKPIHTVIQVQIVTWFDKVKGNTYSSGKATVNFDETSAQYVRFTAQSESMTEKELLHLVWSNFKSFEKYRGVYKSELLKAGVFVQVQVQNNVSYRVCKDFGEGR